MNYKDIKIGMISVLYNPSEYMIKNILINAQGVDKLIIIDNSNDFNEKLIYEVNQTRIDFKYIPNYRNAGLAKSINKGMKIIRSLDIKWCLVLDQDSEAANDMIEVYKEYISKHDTEKIGILGPQFHYDNKRIKQYDRETNKKCLMLSGNLISIPAFIDVGGFNEGFFIDGLDIDYDYRLIEHGYRIIQCLGAVIHHCPGQRKKISLGRIELYYGVAEPFRYYHQARAGVYNGLCHSKIYGLKELSKKLFKIIFLFSEKKKYLRAFRRGLKDGFYWYIGKDA